MASPSDEIKGSELLARSLAKVLELLNPTTWLPAAMLIGNLYLLAHLPSEHDSITLTAWFDRVTTTRTPGLTAFIFLILTSLILQNVESPVCRLMQGLWGHSAPLCLLARVCIHFQRRRRKRLDNLSRVLRMKAFEDARVALTLPGVDGHRDADEEAWRPFAQAHNLARLDATLEALKHYPVSHRMQPTRLGNILRAAEERATSDDLSPDEALLERFDTLPATLKDSHDHSRSLLDMACSLTAVLATLAILSLTLLLIFRNQYEMRFALVGLYSVLAVVSYQAATANAAGYGEMLNAVAERLYLLTLTPMGRDHINMV